MHVFTTSDPVVPGIATRKSGLLLKWFKAESASSALQVEVKAIHQAVCIAKDRKWKRSPHFQDGLLVTQVLLSR